MMQRWHRRRLAFAGVIRTPHKNAKPRVLESGACQTGSGRRILRFFQPAGGSDIAYRSSSYYKQKPAGFGNGGLLLFNFARPFFAVALAGESFFGAALFPWLQVEGMPLDLFNDVFLLYFPFKPSQSAFERLAILQMDFCQLKIHHLPELPV
jgi:hypothetical protein